MSGIERLAQANELRSAVENVNRARRELANEPPPDTVAIAAEVYATVVECDGRAMVHASIEVVPRLMDPSPGLIVRIPTGALPDDVRACLEHIAAEYAGSYEAIQRKAESVAVEVLGDLDPDVPF